MVGPVSNMSVCPAGPLSGWCHITLSVCSSVPHPEPSGKGRSPLLRTACPAPPSLQTLRSRERSLVLMGGDRDMSDLLTSTARRALSSTGLMLFNALNGSGLWPAAPGLSQQYWLNDVHFRRCVWGAVPPGGALTIIHTELSFVTLWSQ